MFPTPIASASISRPLQFEWVEKDGRTYPLVPVQFVRQGVTSPTIHMMLIDTGADISVLPLSFLGLVGVRQAQLRKASSIGLAGRIECWRGGRGLGLSVLIGKAFIVPFRNVEFASFDGPPILGRDVLFGDFELLMTKTLIQLRRLT